jgi:hypothetical protein
VRKRPYPFGRGRTSLNRCVDSASVEASGLGTPHADPSRRPRDVTIRQTARDARARRLLREAAILTGERRNASVTAASDANLFVLFGTEFRVLERDYPDAAEKITQKSLERTADAPQT